jgi:hypothetical protein
VLREETVAYSAYLGANNDALSLENAFFWNEFLTIPGD